MTPLTATLPTPAALKTQAKRLRADLARTGQEITHAQSLEMVAHQWGARDWNTALAQAGTSHPGWSLGQRVTGRYLGHPFVGVVKAVRQSSAGFYSMTLRFDKAVDVVTSEHFSSYRQQVNTTVNEDGHSPQKTSDGQPHMMLDLPK